MFGILNKPGIYDAIAAKAERLKSNMVAICATSWQLPVYKQTLTYELSSMRKMTALEEYILKAADMKLSYDIEASMLPSLFGLDEVFFEEVMDYLTAKGALDKEALPILKLTEAGRSFLNQGMISAEALTESIEYYIDRKFATVYATPSDETRIGMHPRYDAIDKAKENAAKYINRKFALEAGKIIGKDIENPKLGTRITSIVSAKTTDACRAMFTEIYLYDIENSLFVRKVWDHSRKCFHEELAELLDKANIDSGFKLTAIKPDTLSADICRLAKEKDKLRICRGKLAENAVSEAVSSAKKELMIHIPLIASDALAKIIELCTRAVQNGVEVIVTYASCNDAMPDSQSGIKFMQLEQNDCNATEIIADDSICILSGLQWASCSGTATACSDAVYVVSDEEFVKTLNTNILNRFNEEANT